MAEKTTSKSKKALAKENPFPHKNLISVKDLTKEQVYYLFELANKYLVYNSKFGPKTNNLLRGLTSINLFLEPSTRTRISFETAAKRLGMEVINFAPSDSSRSKGETEESTVDTLWAMAPDLIVLRSPRETLLQEVLGFLECPVINAGDGTNEHPTQALLDAFTIIHEMERLKKTTNFNKISITICGDIKHSRVARSNLILLDKLGANLRVCAPPELIPSDFANKKIEIYHDIEKAIENVDVVMMLRYQKERMEKEIDQETINEFQLNEKRLKKAKKDVILMHPGPVIWGSEINEDLKRSQPSTTIAMQVIAGVAVRMAILDVLTRPLREKT